MVQRQDIDSSSAYLSVVITRDEVKSKLDAELKRVRQRAQIKGFRQGQAPMDYIRKVYGQAIMVDTVNDLVSKQLFDYIEENKIEILGQPLASEDQQRYTFSINNLEPEYVVKYEIGFVPDFEIKGINNSYTYEILVPSDLDELAANDLLTARSSMRRQTSVEDTIQSTDIVKINAVELEGDEPKPDGLHRELTFSISDIPNEAIKEMFLAAKKGDVVRFNPFEMEDKGIDFVRKHILALEEGDEREVNPSFEGTISEVLRSVEADLDSQFFEEYFGNPELTEAQALDMMKGSISDFYKRRAEIILMWQLQDRLVELNDFPLPADFLRRWLIYRNEGNLSAEFLEKEFDSFLEGLRWNTLRDKLVEKFNIHVSEQEVDFALLQRIMGYFQQLGMGNNIPQHMYAGVLQRIKQNKEEVEQTRKNVELEKMLMALMASVSVVDKMVHSNEIDRIYKELAGQNAPDAFTPPGDEPQGEEMVSTEEITAEEEVK